jgi:hypothetical protein
VEGKNKENREKSKKNLCALSVSSLRPLRENGQRESSFNISGLKRRKKGSRKDR